MPMPSRLQMLAGLAASGGLLAGCVNRSESATDSPTDTDNDTAVTFPEDTTADACPSVPGADQTVCYEAVDPDTVPLALVPGSQSLEPDQSTTFTLRNQSEQALQTNFYDWQIYKRVDGDWYYILPDSTPMPLNRLEPGGTHTWTVTVSLDDMTDGGSVDRVEGNDTVTVTALGGGHYAFVTRGSVPTGAAGTANISFVAGFDLEAPSLELTRTDAIDDTEWDGGTLIAQSTRGSPLDSDDKRDAYILERIDATDTTPEEVIIEQVVRNEQLRDAIALSQAFDADTVRLEEYSRSDPAFGLGDATPTYEFRGQGYRVRGIEGGGA